ncbi:MAG: DsbA family oxidoreductase [Pseudonocardiaceae bacterium]
MPTTIEVFSDFVCPFCYLAEQPLADSVEGPGVPSNSGPNPRRLCGPRLNTWDRVVYPMAERVGVPIVLPAVSPQPYSHLAFEGFAYAEERGRGQRYTERMFRAFFVEQLDIGRPEILMDIAKELGLDGDTFRSALESGRYAATHQRALRRARELEITVVPTFLVDGQRLESMPSAEGCAGCSRAPLCSGSDSPTWTALR